MSASPALDATIDVNLSAEVEASMADTPAQALEALYRSHFRKLVGYFRRCGVGDAVATELAQDAFVNALRGLANFKGDSKLSTWLWTIARNVLLAHLRSNPLARLADEPVDPDSLTNGEDPRLNDMCDSIRRGFATFAMDHPERAQVLYLAAVEGWSIAELAEFLGRTPHAATEYLSQCRAKLKPYLADCDDRS
ncbi:MAG: sigma-70 family RNA polymerase sigma factor [Hylemonella sp.]|nr:sigma-70 family RNA polymerase sigma factor [Hylemonella sp.]